MSRRGPRSSSRILDYVVAHCWAMRQTTFDSLLQVLVRHLDGETLAAEAVDAIVAAREAAGRGRVERDYAVHGGVAVLPVSGVLVKHADMVNGSSQPRGTATETIHAQLGAALEDDEVQSILLDIDSPGGSVDGIAVLADRIREADAKKPVVAYAADLMASAAYWIAAQASAVYAAKGAEVGSVGVIATMLDRSREQKNLGRDIHVIRAGANKGLTDPVSGAFGERQREKVQHEVQRYYDLFVDAVAAGRGMARDDVLEVATGDVWLAGEAVELNLIDGVRTFEQVLEAMKAEVRETAAVGGSDGRAFAAAGENPMSDKPTSQPQPAAGATPTVSAPPSQTQAPPVPAAPMQVDTEAISRQAKEAERTRVSTILSDAAPGQESLAQELIRNDVSVLDARGQMIQDAKRRQAAAAAAGRLNPPVGGSADEHMTVRSDTAPTAPSETWPKGAELARMSQAEVMARAAKEWDDPKAKIDRAEFFGSPTNYAGYRLQLWQKAQFGGGS